MCRGKVKPIYPDGSVSSKVGMGLEFMNERIRIHKSSLISLIQYKKFQYT